MKAVLMLLFMIWLHIFADYHLQGILANMKQKSWWIGQKKNNQNIFYGELDYKVALLTHCIEWSFFVCLPMAISGWERMIGEVTWSSIKVIVTLIALIVANTLFHYITDDMKANENSISLFVDQAMHLLQIIFSWLMWTIICGW